MSVKARLRHSFAWYSSAVHNLVSFAWACFDGTVIY